MPFINPHEVVNRLNHDMYNDFSNVGMFTTVMIGLLDSSTHSLQYCNAGQSPIYYIPVNGEPVLLEAQDIPVGIFDVHTYSTQTISLSSGDIFVAASDGFPESCNPAGEMFGYERMKSALNLSRDLPSKKIVENLLDSVYQFCGTHPQEDDRTIVVIKFQKSGE